MDRSEISATLALNTEPFSKAIVRSKAQLSDFAEAADKNFLKATRSGKAFHQLVEQLNDVIPGMGSLAAAAMNPVALALTAATVAFTGVKKAIDDYNKELDKVAEENAKPIWGAKEIQQAKDGIHGLRQELAAYKKTLSPDSIEETVKAISAESDPKLKLSQARQERDRLAAERDAKLKELNDLEKHQERLTTRSTKIPGELTAAEKTLKLISENPFLIDPNLATDPEGPSADPDSLQSEAKRYERSRQLAEARVQRLRAEQMANPDESQKSKERSEELRHGITTRQRALGQLQDLIDPLAPLDALPRGKRIGTFSISSGEQHGAPAGFVEMMDKWGAHLEKLAGTVEGSYLRARVPNSQ